MSNLPAPLVAADVDVGPLDGFMLDVVRLLGSELVALSTGDEFKAAVLLWCRAWKQRPAASLPNDERTLASYAGYGNGTRVDVKCFSSVKAMALRGFILCSDGRLYHPVLAEDALKAAKALRNRRDWREKKQKQRSSPNGQDQGQPPGHNEGQEPGHTYKSDEDTARDTGGDKRGEIALRDGTGRDVSKKEDSPYPKPREVGGATGGIPPTPNLEDRLPELEALWPHGEGRQHNRVNWTFACGKADPETIIAGARAWVAAYDGKGQFLPRLSMWLRDGEWANKPREQSKPGQKPTAVKPNRAQVLGMLARLNTPWKAEWTAHYGWTPTATELTDARKAWLTACASGRAIDKSLYGDSPVTDAERETARRELAKPIDLVAEMPAHLRRKAAAPAPEPAAPLASPADSFADLWAIWPRRDSQISARATLAAVLDAGTEPQALLTAAKAYLASTNSPSSLDGWLTTQLPTKPDGVEAA